MCLETVENAGLSTEDGKRFDILTCFTKIVKYVYDCDLWIFTLNTITTPVRWYVAFPITVTSTKPVFPHIWCLVSVHFGPCLQVLPTIKRPDHRFLLRVQRARSAAAVHWSHTCPDALPYVVFMGEVCNIFSVFQDWTDVICWPLHLLYSDALLVKMGGSGSKTKAVWPFSSSGAGGEAPGEINEQCLTRLRGSKSATPFVFTRRR